jgi:hypothetical protein
MEDHRSSSRQADHMRPRSPTRARPDDLPAHHGGSRPEDLSHHERDLTAR